MKNQEHITKPFPEETIQPQNTAPKPQKEKVKYREFGKKAFLNLSDRESNAFISVFVKNHRWDGYAIRITDCNEKIKLHGSLKKAVHRKNALHKVDTLIETLTELREHMISEFNRHNLKH